MSDAFRRVTFRLPGGTMAGIALGRETRNPDIVFLHATGFNARAYRTMLAPLGERYHVLALDLRGHGRTRLPTPFWGYSSWRQHADDVAHVLESRFTAPATLAGHSLGATVALLLAGRRPDLAASLALIEPVIQNASFYSAIQVLGATTMMRALFPLARAARRRRNVFPDRKIAVRSFSGRGVFKVFTGEAIEDYVADGLIRDGRGAWKLACEPAYEAATFAAQRHDPWAALRRAKCPLVLLRAERQSTVSPAALRRIPVMRPDARIAVIEGAGHMLPMERPDRARAAIESAVLLRRGPRTES